MTTPTTTELLHVAEEAARTAGHHALDQIDRRNEIESRTDHDVKLKLDIECQEKAEAVIRSAYPDHAFLGEEGGALPTGDEPLWIVDPIDGTVNFTHGIPLWCSSVAVRVGDQVQAGCVFAPVLNDCYTATADGPSFCNGEPIQPSSADRLRDAMVLTGLSKDSDAYQYTMRMMDELAFKARKVRMLGSAALDLCHVASGKAEACIELSIFLWDIAAGGLIAERAGAKTELLGSLGEIQFRHMCTNGRVHDELLTIVNEALK